MSDVPNAVQKLLSSLNEEYAQQLPGKIQLIEDLWNSLLEKYNYDDFKRLHLRVHSLAGSSATFGRHLN